MQGDMEWNGLLSPGIPPPPATGRVINNENDDKERKSQKCVDATLFPT